MSFHVTDFERKEIEALSHYTGESFSSVMKRAVAELYFRLIKEKSTKKL